MHTLMGFVLFVVGLIFIGLSAYLLFSGRLLSDGISLVLGVGAALFGFVLCITGYRMSQGNL